MEMVEIPVDYHTNQHIIPRWRIIDDGFGQFLKPFEVSSFGSCLEPILSQKLAQNSIITQSLTSKLIPFIIERVRTSSEFDNLSPKFECYND